MGAVFRWVKFIYEWCKNFAQILGGGSGVGEIDALAGIGNGVNYHVDGVAGDNANDGLSWAKAVKTIEQAIALSDAFIDALLPSEGPGDAPQTHYNTIWVKPGVYAENLTFPYFCHLVGLGLRGTDTMVEIEPTEGSCFTGIMRATHLANLKLMVYEADTPILDISIVVNSLIESCTFTIGAAVTGVAGIDTEDCKDLRVRDCDFISGMAEDLAYGFYHRGGANKYLYNCRFINNRIFASECGIWIEGNCNSHNTVIKGNVIRIPSAGAPAGIGIDDNFGYSLCIDNWIAALDAIDHAGGDTYLIANHVITAGAGAVEADGTD